MDSKWFANRGQVLQLAVTVVACIIAAINAWPNMKADQIVSIGPIIFYLLIALVLISLVRFGLPRPAQAPTISEPTPPSKPQLPRRILSGGDPSIMVSPVKTSAEVISLTKRVGEFWEVTDGVTHLRINIVEIVSPKRPDEPFLVELTFDGNPLQIVGGSETKEVSRGRFVLPANNATFSSERTSAIALYFSDTMVHGIAIWVRHVNPHDRTVNLKICYVYGRGT